MLSIRSLSLLTTALCASLTSAAPAPQASAPASGSSTYWFANMDHSHDLVYPSDASNYTVFRDVTQYGADSTGATDSSDAINLAMADGGRCGGSAGSCDSQTTTPAIVYFPPGNYLVAKPILMYYYTQMIGDPTDLPTITVPSSFNASGSLGVIDSDPYDYSNGGAVNWYTNQNNFFRQVRNFIIDMTDAPYNSAGIHWQVAQATSLQNIVFNLSPDPSQQHKGVFMDNGSGGFFSDLTFNNGYQCAFLGSQQFTSRNLVFNNCQTAILMNWNWGWTLHNVSVTGGEIGLDMSALSGDDPSLQNQTVGSVVLADSTISSTHGVKFAYQNDSSNLPQDGGSLFINNVDFSQTSAAVVNYDNTTVLAPGVIESWASGNTYTPGSSSSQTTLSPVKQMNPIAAPNRAPALLTGSGQTAPLFTQSRPQYENLLESSFISAMQSNCTGTGKVDDTAAITKLLAESASTGKVAYFEHGAYLVSDTIYVPPGAKMTGEIWPIILASGVHFNDSSNPKPVFQVGKPGESGSFQISDMVFETYGSAVGAVMIEWNLNSTQSDPSGMWDTHVRIGGTAGTLLEGANGCQSENTTDTSHNGCDGVFLMFHATKASSGVYLENTWFWVADHNLDLDQPSQISIYSARGALFQSQGPVWLWGTASEHSILYNYQFDGVNALYAGFMQSETPYFQPLPSAPEPFSFNYEYDDPLFTICSNETTADSPPCKDAWGLRIYNSRNVLIYSAGLYSFFNSYDQSCVASQNCQENMMHIQNSQVDIYAYTTIGAVNMIRDDDVGLVLSSGNQGPYGDVISVYTTGQ